MNETDEPEKPKVTFRAIVGGIAFVLLILLIAFVGSAGLLLWVVR